METPRSVTMMATMPPVVRPASDFEDALDCALKYVYRVSKSMSTHIKQDQQAQPLS